MIRERISPNGISRPLESPSELAALQMPVDEIGMLKEGPASRYLDGQALWAKKYARAARQVEKRRLKNIKRAEEKDGRELRKMWGERVKRGSLTPSSPSTPTVSEDPKEGRSGTERGQPVGDRQNGTETGGQTESTSKDILDQSWSWTWALHGESPPPSAIVSRRDFVSVV